MKPLALVGFALVLVGLFLPAWRHEGGETVSLMKATTIPALVVVIGCLGGAVASIRGKHGIVWVGVVLVGLLLAPSIFYFIDPPDGGRSLAAANELTEANEPPSFSRGAKRGVREHLYASSTLPKGNYLPHVAWLACLAGVALSAWGLRPTAVAGWLAQK